MAIKWKKKVRRGGVHGSRPTELGRRLSVAGRDTMAARILADIPPWLVEAERVMQAKGETLAMANWDMSRVDQLAGPL